MTRRSQTMFGAIKRPLNYENINVKVLAKIRVVVFKLFVRIKNIEKGSSLQCLWSYHGFQEEKLANFSIFVSTFSSILSNEMLFGQVAYPFREISAPEISHANPMGRLS